MASQSSYYKNFRITEDTITPVIDELNRRGGYTSIVRHALLTGTRLLTREVIKKFMQQYPPGAGRVETARKRSRKTLTVSEFSSYISQLRKVYYVTGAEYRELMLDVHPDNWNSETITKGHDRKTRYYYGVQFAKGNKEVKWWPKWYMNWLDGGTAIREARKHKFKGRLLKQRKVNKVTGEISARKGRGFYAREGAGYNRGKIQGTSFVSSLATSLQGQLQTAMREAFDKRVSQIFRKAKKNAAKK